MFDVIEQNSSVDCKNDILKTYMPVQMLLQGAVLVYIPKNFDITLLCGQSMACQSDAWNMRQTSI